VVTPPTPANFHAVFGITANAPFYPGGAMQIDVAGDAVIAETPTSDSSAPNLGDDPTHAAILPNNTRVYVAGVGSVIGATDTVSYFTPAFQTSPGSGFGPVSSINLPSQASSIVSVSESGNLVTVTLSAALSNVTAGQAIVITNVVIPPCAPSPCSSLPQNAYDGGFTISSVSGTTLTYVDTTGGLPALSAGGTATFPPQPVFLNSTQNTAMYVANYNANSVSAINATTNVVSNTAPVGMNPVSLAEMPNGLKLYVANQGDNTISSLNTVDLSPNALTGFTGTTPVWMVARGDSQKVYVLTQGDGKLVTIDTATDVATTPDCSVTPSLCVGAGANFMLLDPHLNRIYVTNPATGLVYVFSDSGGANDTPSLLTPNGLTVPGLTGLTMPVCTTCGPVIPTSVAALPDGSRFYVASYQVATPCPDPLAGSAASCIVPTVTVFNANNFTFEYPNPSAPVLTLLTDPPFAANVAVNQYQYGVAPVAACGPIPAAPTAIYSPGSTRFRVFTTSSADGSRVYVSTCDAGVVAVINTTGSNNNNPGSGTPEDTVTTDLPAAFSSGAAQSNGLPPNQNPIFLLAGQ
jgi:YVTN family beta-propeller protein